jgi:DNA-binding NarL/FixJ family response regulator
MAGHGVLIVDDNWLFLEAARDRLEREGLRVVGVAATSAEALRRAEDTYIGDTTPGQARGNNLNLNGGLWHEVPASR